MEPGSHFVVWISCWSQEVVVMPSGDASEPGSHCVVWIFHCIASGARK